MAGVLAYVDAPLVRQVATGVIGSEVKLTERNGTTTGINFKILLSRNTGKEQSVTTKISEVLPEVAAEAVREETKCKIDNLEGARELLVAGGRNSFKPGMPIIVTNAIFSSDGKSSPVQLSGEPCAQYRLKIGDFFLHAYCSVGSEGEIDGFISQPVEVLGLLRYTAAYPVPGAMSLNLGLRICAIWLR